MSLFAFGVNYQSASIDIREKLSFSPNSVINAMQEIKNSDLAKEVVIFSTCNRTELYFTGTDTPNHLYQWMSEYHSVDLPTIKNHSYLYQDDLASRHLFRVATGLDSLALGEPQILGQIKEAYRQSIEAKTVNQTLNKLFQEAFYVAKSIRSSTKIGENSISIAYAAIKLTGQFFSDHSNLTAIIIGAGETGRLAAKILAKKGVGKIIIANRNLTKAQNIARDLHGYACPFEQINEHIHEADIIVSATSKSDYTVCSDLVKAGQRLRKNQIQLFLDLAVPRDIDPTVSQLENTYLYAVDDLQEVIEQNKELRLYAAEQAEDLINEYNKHFIDWLHLRKHHDLIRNIHAFAQKEKDKLLTQAIKQVNAGEDPEKILQLFATKLTKKLIHQPSVLVRRASETNNIEALDEIKSIYEL